MNPVDITTAVTVEQKVFEGKTVTISNSVEEIQSENVLTKTVISKVLVEYPLFKKYNITEISLTESDFSNEFEITYTNTATNQETTVIVRTDVDGKTITIEDLSTTQIGGEVLITPALPVVIYTKEEFNSTAAQKIVSVVNTKLQVDSVTSIVS